MTRMTMLPIQLGVASTMHHMMDGTPKMHMHVSNMMHTMPPDKMMHTPSSPYIGMYGHMHTNILYVPPHTHNTR